MTNTYLIGKHLKLLKPDIKIERCCLCNTSGFGFKKKNMLPSIFADSAYLNASDEICVYCVACLGKGQQRNEWIRAYSFIATEESLRLLKREHIWKEIFDAPQSPFVFGVTYGHKKHISFKAPVCLSNKQYQIQTDNGRIDIDLNNIHLLTTLIQKWYSIRKDAKQEATWFTKNEILTGSSNFKRIEEYGIDDYFQENAIIKSFRNTALLELLCFALNKGSMSKRQRQNIDTTKFILPKISNKSEQLFLF